MKKLWLGSALLIAGMTQVGCSQIEEFSQRPSQGNSGKPAQDPTKGGIAVQLPKSMVRASKIRAHGFAHYDVEAPGAMPSIHQDQPDSGRVSISCSDSRPIMREETESRKPRPAVEPLIHMLSNEDIEAESCEAPIEAPYRPIAWMETELTERFGRRLMSESVTLPFDCIGQAQLMLNGLNPRSQYQVSAVLRSGFDDSIVYQGSTEVFSGGVDLSSVKLVMRRQSGGGIDIIFEDEEDIEDQLPPGVATVECVQADGSLLKECRGEFYRVPRDGREIVEIDPVSCALDTESKSCRIDVKGIGRLVIIDSCSGIFEMQIDPGHASFSQVKICDQKPAPIPMPQPPQPVPAPQPVTR